MAELSIEGGLEQLEDVSLEAHAAVVSKSITEHIQIPVVWGPGHADTPGEAAAALRQLCLEGPRCSSMGAPASRLLVFAQAWGRKWASQIFAVQAQRVLPAWMAEADERRL